MLNLVIGESSKIYYGLSLLVCYSVRKRYLFNTRAESIQHMVKCSFPQMCVKPRLYIRYTAHMYIGCVMHRYLMCMCLFTMR